MSQNSGPSIARGAYSNDGQTRMTWVRKPKSGTLLCLALLILAQTGCCCFNTDPTRTRMLDEAFVRYRDCVWARRAYNQEYGHMFRPFADHFQKGYVAGYCAVCRGGDGFVPATPPKDYMNYEYQSEDGAGCVNAWFEGYPAGAQAAKQRNLDKYSNIYISRLMETAIQQNDTGAKLPGDVKVVSPASQPGIGTIPVAEPPMPVLNSSQLNRSYQ